jgi:hypothetical protein
MGLRRRAAAGGTTIERRQGMTGADILAGRGLAAERAPAPSAARFPDGAHFRIEIPSVEGPAVLRAVVEAAVATGVTVNRVSQGSGAMLLSEAELAEMARIGADTGTEVSLFVGPREEWDIGRSAQAGDGAGLAGRLRGTRQLRYALDDVLRGEVRAAQRAAAVPKRPAHRGGRHSHRAGEGAPRGRRAGVDAPERARADPVRAGCRGPRRPGALAMTTSGARGARSGARQRRRARAGWRVIDPIVRGIWLRA